MLWTKWEKLLPLKELKDYMPEEPLLLSDKPPIGLVDKVLPNSVEIWSEVLINTHIYNNNINSCF